MNHEDFPADPSELRKVWSFMTVHMSRRRIGYLPHGIESETEKIHELVLIDDGPMLTARLNTPRMYSGYRKYPYG